MNIIIRQAAQDDAMAIYNFICHLENSQFDYEAFLEIFLSNISNKNNHYLVATAGGKELLGFISCHIQSLLHHCGRVAEIQELFVTEASRQHGVGRMLAKELEQIIRQENCPILEVTAQNKREQAHRFYESLSFNNTHKKFVKELGNNE